MKVTAFAVEHFRNLQQFRFEPCEGANIIYGDNAQGKTNLLEAIWLFSGSRSFRGASDKDFIQKKKDFTSLSLDFMAQKRDQKAVLRYGENRRVITLNEIKKNSYSAYSGVFCAVIFSPDHLSLVKDGPEGRRGMLDTSLTQAYPKYTKVLENYNKALRQRNSLLKDIYKQPQLQELLSIWDQYIIDYGGYISAVRDRYSKQLAAHASEIYRGISNRTEELTVRYLPSFSDQTAGFELIDYQNAIENQLLKNHETDLRHGSTSVGPHRDDLEIEINGMSARTFGSQGQQRSSVLALKLAECAILEEQNGEPPVVMLDDVMSELDHHRRNYLLNKLQNKQVFITCCDTSAFAGMEHGKVFYMEQGMLTEVKK